MSRPPRPFCIVIVLVLAVACQSPASPPAVSSTNETADAKTRGTLEHGDYLVNHVLVCVECHTEKDGSRYANPMVGPPGAGGECFGPEAGIPGTICSTNLTSDAQTGLGNWSDEEILRATREGVNRNGDDQLCTYA